MENYRSGLQPEWPGEAGRGLAGKEWREEPQSQAQGGDDKSSLCLDSVWREPGTRGREVGTWFGKRKLVRGKAWERKQRKVRDREGRDLGGHREGT